MKIHIGDFNSLGCPEPMRQTGSALYEVSNYLSKVHALLLSKSRVSRNWESPQTMDGGPHSHASGC